MYSFANDYSESVHPRILENLVKIGLEQNEGYGLDCHCENAGKLLKRQLQNEEVDIHFLPGGTITNLTFLSHVLRSYQAVIAADTGHIYVHETGAIEATGHKVIAVPTPDGKLRTEDIELVLKEHNDEHMVMPAMVYVSNPTEVGTVYSKAELEILYQCCKENHLFFYLDGARLSMALAVEEANLAMEDLPKLTDAFYIGGTKAGMMFGEALIIVKENLQQNFRHSVKQHGAMSAKGWLLGMQFETLFEDGLYYSLGKHANKTADLLRKAFAEASYSFLTASPTNQVFPILPDALAETLLSQYHAQEFRKIGGGHTCFRFCTSWATKEEDVRQFLEDFRKIVAKADGLE